MTLTSMKGKRKTHGYRQKQKSYPDFFVAPCLFLLCCSTYFQSSLKIPALDIETALFFSLQLVWILTIHLLQQN